MDIPNYSSIPPFIHPCTHTSIHSYIHRSIHTSAPLLYSLFGLSLLFWSSLIGRSQYSVFYVCGILKVIEKIQIHTFQKPPVCRPRTGKQIHGSVRNCLYSENLKLIASVETGREGVGMRGYLAYVSGVTHKKEQVEHISIEEQ